MQLEAMLNIGERMVVEREVRYEDTVGNASNQLSQLLSTSACVNTFIRAAVDLVDRHLPEGNISVVRSVSITHEAPTLFGEKVRFEITLDRVEGGHLFFSMEAYDTEGLVCRGVMERAVVNPLLLMGRATSRGKN